MNVSQVARASGVVFSHINGGCEQQQRGFQSLFQLVERGSRRASYSLTLPADLGGRGGFQEFSRTFLGRFSDALVVSSFFFYKMYNDGTTCSNRVRMPGAVFGARTSRCAFMCVILFTCMCFVLLYLRVIVFVNIPYVYPLVYSLYACSVLRPGCVPGGVRDGLERGSEACPREV